jgi:hypothetical protein
MPRHEIESLVRKFVSDLEVVLREEALAIVQASLLAALGGQEIVGNKPASKRSVPKSKTRVRRSEAELLEAEDRVVEYVRKNPGARSEHIRAAVGLDKTQWVTTISGLIVDRRLRAHGVRRNTIFTLA